MYEIAVDEIENNEFDKVAQAIAFEEAEGDEKKSRAFYTKHRVRRIKDEISYFVAELAATIEAEAKRSAEQNKVRKIEARKNNVKEIGVKTAKGFWYIFFLSAFGSFSYLPLLQFITKLSVQKHYRCRLH